MSNAALYIFGPSQALKSGIHFCDQRLETPENLQSRKTVNEGENLRVCH